MIKAAFVVCLFLLFNCSFGQNKVVFFITDAAARDTLSNVSIVAKGTDPGTVSDNRGRAVIMLPDGKSTITFSSVGYKTLELTFTFPLVNKDSVLHIEMEKEEKELEQVVVSSSRTESRIENLPTKVEVLGFEEVNEEVGIKPGNIASLLGDIAGIQTQQMSAATGNMEMRVQGLPGKYTQLLRDGMPLFGGYAGSFSILQIPPLDLKQIEIIKGASSTLYGGGAIAGMINLVSKRPRDGKPERTFLFNQSSLGETNINLYFSERKKKTGYTLFGGGNLQHSKDVNKDGFSDVARTDGFFFHPTAFFYPDTKNLISIGFNSVMENRKGGDMLVLQDKADAAHQYFVQNKTQRNSLEANWENKLNTSDRFTFKATGSWLNREITTSTFGMKAKQLSYFSEASWLKKSKKNDQVAGLNLTGENFTKYHPDSTFIPDEKNTTIGLFLQDDWRLTKKLTLQSGIRYDHHNRYGHFLLPRLSLLYKINSTLTSRLGGGLGYKIPTLFSSETDERDYGLLLPFNGVKAERSGGINWDINYHQQINEWELTINQTFYFTTIKDPVAYTTDANSFIRFYTAAKPLATKGFETYIQATHNELEIYLGYTYTLAEKKYDPVQRYLSLSARNKFATVLAYEFSDRFRAGIEAALTGKQYLDDGSRTPAYLFLAAMMRYDIGKFAFVLNCENLFDYRQTRKESILLPPVSNPRFKQLWAPLDGRVVNLSVRLSLL